jgi:hypothetical protein
MISVSGGRNPEAVFKKFFGSTMAVKTPTKGIEMAEKDPIARIKELDAERARLLDEAKKEALARAQQAVADLNALGFAYNLTQISAGRKAVGKRATGRIPVDNPCRICGFRTNPPHDARKHRFSKARKRPFTAKELTDLGLRKV